MSGHSPGGAPQGPRAIAAPHPHSNFPTGASQGAHNSALREGGRVAADAHGGGYLSRGTHPGRESAQRRHTPMRSQGTVASSQSSRGPGWAHLAVGVGPVGPLRPRTRPLTKGWLRSGRRGARSTRRVRPHPQWDGRDRSHGRYRKRRGLASPAVGPTGWVGWV